MLGNVSNGEEKPLSVKQQQLIAALIAGNSIVVAAATVGIAEKTAHAWSNNLHSSVPFKRQSRSFLMNNLTPYEQMYALPLIHSKET